MTDLITWPSVNTPADEPKWKSMVKQWWRSGVYKNATGTNDFAPFGDATGMNIKVGTGACLISGFHAEMNAQSSVDIEPADVDNGRIDRIVLRCDTSGGSAQISLIAITGTPDQQPTPPVLTDTATISDVPLARVVVGKGVNTIVSTAVIDERTFMGVRNLGTVTPLGLGSTASGGITGIPADGGHVHPVDQNLIRLGMPVGTFEHYLGNSDPGGVFAGIYMLMDGRALVRGQYTALWNMIGVTWGAGDGSQTFNIPTSADIFFSGAGPVRGPLGTRSGNDLGVARHTHDPVEQGDPNQMLISSGVAENHQIATSAAPGNVNVTFSPLYAAGTTDPRLAIPAYATVNYILKVL